MVQPYYAQRKMPIDVGTAKMDYPSFYTGRESQAIAEFAKAFGGTADLAVKRMNSIAQTEYTTGKAEWETAHNIFLDDLREDPDSDNYIKKYDAYSKKVQKDILATKSEVSKKHLSEMFKSKTPSVKKAIGDIAWERKQGVLGADVLTAVRSHELSGNSSAAEAALIEAVNAGILEPKFAANRAMQIKRNVDWNNGYQMAGSDPEGLLKIIDGGFFPNLDKQDIEQLRSRAEISLARKTTAENEQLEIQREADRDVISKAIQSADPDIVAKIDESNLDEAEQWTWNERARADLKRRADGEEIITDHEVRSRINSGVFQMLTGAKTKKEVLDEAKAARFDPDNPTLNETDYNKIETAINAQYEQAYTGAMSKVTAHAMGTLLNPDSLGFIKNAPVRYKTLADFQQAWMKWIADKGDTLKTSDIYPEGVRMATMYQISDAEAERQEVEMNTALAEREKEHPTKGGGLQPLLRGKDIPEEYRKLGVTEYRPPGKGIVLPPPKPMGVLEKAVGKENARMETKAWGVLYDLWDEFKIKTREKIRADYKSGKTFTEIMQDKAVEAEINKIVGKKPAKEKSPYKEYPDAFKEGDNWYVMRDGKRYRIED